MPSSTIAVALESKVEIEESFGNDPYDAKKIYKRIGIEYGSNSLIKQTMFKKLSRELCTKAFLKTRETASVAKFNRLLCNRD